MSGQYRCYNCDRAERIKNLEGYAAAHRHHLSTGCPARTTPKETPMTQLGPVTLNLYELDHQTARFRHEPPVSIDTITTDHARVGLDLPLRTWHDLGRPTTIKTTVNNPNDDLLAQDRTDQHQKTPDTHLHLPIQHRDGKPPWCNICGLTAERTKPTSPSDRPALAEASPEVPNEGNTTNG